MTRLARTIAVAAALAVSAANPAVADHTAVDTDVAEDAELTFAVGTVETGHGVRERVRMVAGEVDGKGVLYAEYYVEGRLRYAPAYWRVYIEGSEYSIRDLTALELSPKQTPDGFAFTASLSGTRLSCVALVYGDGSASCSRDPSWTPKGSASCAAAFKGEVGRFQCNGLQDHFTTPAIAHEELIRVCSAAFRWETFREDCLRTGYNNEARLFRETLAACTSAYRTEEERKFCLFYSFAHVNAADRIPLRFVRECDKKHDDDKATTKCAFELHTGSKQVDAKPGPWHPAIEPTERVKRALATSPASGGRVDVGRGAWRELSIRATGGMVGNEPILWLDAHTKAGKHEWTMLIDRIVIGKRVVIALREVTSLDRVKLAGDVLTFRVTLDGKQLACRADAAEIHARCR